MRATMSLPLVFPPVELDGRVLVDGGAMNNVPADVVKAMGADRVVAINVGDLSDPEDDRLYADGPGGRDDRRHDARLDEEFAELADVVVNVPLKEFGSLDWRRSADLITEGYKAAEAMRDRLLPLAVSESDYERWRQDRESRRRRQLPAPTFVRLEGFEAADTRRLEALFARRGGVALDPEALETNSAGSLG